MSTTLYFVKTEGNSDVFYDFMEALFCFLHYINDGSESVELKFSA